MTSIKDVAKKANVSTATVSHVINNSRFVSEHTKTKVYEAMKILDYTPNMIARSLRNQKTKTIGLIVPLVANDTSNMFFMSIANGIESILSNNGYSLILSNSKEDLLIEQEHIKMFDNQYIDGLIIAPVSNDANNYYSLLQKKYPVVFIDRKPKSLESDVVLIDNQAGAYQAISNLVEDNHKNIGFISGPLNISSSLERLEGLKQRLASSKQKISNSYIREGEATFDNGYKFAAELLEQELTALFVANNIMTLGALSLLQTKNVTIPEEVALIGYDDYEWMRVINPPVSVVQQPSRELGETAARQLLKRIDGSEEQFGEFKLSSTFIQRGSSKMKS